MLTKEEWTKRTSDSPPVNGFVWYTDGSKTLGGAWAGVYWQSFGRRLSICIEKYAAVFQAEIYAIKAYAYEMQMNASPEKYVSIYSDSLAALSAPQAAKTTSPLVQQCPKGVEHFQPAFCGTASGSQEILGYVEMKLLVGSQRVGTVHQAVGPEPALEVPRQNTR